MAKLQMKPLYNKICLKYVLKYNTSRDNTNLILMLQAATEKGEKLTVIGCYGNHQLLA